MPLGPDALLLNDRVALVTGAAAGIGRATALALARFGADVAVCDRDAAGLESTRAAIRALGRAAFASCLDVRDRDAVTAFITSLVAELGPIDVLVNNAGGSFAALFASLSERAQTALVDENFTSVTDVIRACLPHFSERGASIVNVTSIEAHRAGPGWAVYAAMKAAVESLSKSLALELAPRGIRVNCVAPDMIATPGTGPLPPATPLARAGEADDVAAAIVFLAGGAASFITGATLHVDGGNAAAGGWRRRDDGSFSPL